LGGALAAGLGDGSPQAGSRGRAPVEVWGKAPRSSKNVVMRLKNTYGEEKASP